MDGAWVRRATGQEGGGRRMHVQCLGGLGGGPMVQLVGYSKWLHAQKGLTRNILF